MKNTPQKKKTNTKIDILLMTISYPEDYNYSEALQQLYTRYNDLGNPFGYFVKPQVSNPKWSHQDKKFYLLLTINMDPMVFLKKVANCNNLQLQNSAAQWVKYYGTPEMQKFYELKLLLCKQRKILTVVKNGETKN